MNKLKYFLLFLVAIGSLLSCKNANTSTPTEEAVTAPPAPNMGGLEMQRGLIQTTDEATPGYIYFAPLLSGTTYLTNLAGQIVHKWESDYGPSGWSYLKENGNLLRGARQPDAPIYGGGGQGGRIQEFNWDGDLIWDYRFASEAHQSHHDVALMPNGHLLVIAWESRTPEEAIQAGRNPSFIPKAGLWPDKVVELVPNGATGGTIIWEWHIWDHLIQDFDASKDNYGDVAAHPELLNINLNGSVPKTRTEEELTKRRAENNGVTNDGADNDGSDLYHMNAINYNAALDQIVFSSPNLNEIFIIDHSTTTAEAASHAGGRSGQGGDLLYRWGNPENYGRGDSTDQKLAGQHDVKWIDEGLPGAGHLMVFNNRVPNARPPYSAVIELDPPTSSIGYIISDKDPFGPIALVWSYIAEDTTSFFAPFISGADRMANGHTFITEGPKGRYFEVTSSGKVVWDYWTPYSGNVRMPDGTYPQPVGNLIYATFRASRIPANHPAVAGKTLAPLSPQPAEHEPFER